MKHQPSPLLLILLPLGVTLTFAGGHGGGGHGGGQGQGHRERFDGMARGNPGLSPHMAGPTIARVTPMGPAGQDAFFTAMESYLARGAPISTDNDLHYIQNHLAGGTGPLAAPDGALQRPTDKQAAAPASDPRGGTVLASPGQGPAPWEAGVSRQILDADLDMNSGDPYALRVSGIKNSFNANYPDAFRQLNKAIGGGQKDPTALAFGALAAFHRDEMKDAARWAKDALDKEPRGPWAKMSDSVLHLTRQQVAQASDPRTPKPLRQPRAADTPRGAVGPALFPGKSGADGPAPEGTAGTLRAAQRAMTVRDYPLARELARRVLYEDPTNPEALKVSASAALHMGQYAPAYDDATRGLAEEPRDSELLRARALAAGRTGRFDQTLSDALAMLRTNERSSAGLRLLAFAEAARGNRAAMTAALARAAAADPANAELLRRAGELPPGTDAMGLFSDALLLGETRGGPAADASSENRIAYSLIGLGLLTLLGPLAAAMAIQSSRRSKPGPRGLDLSVFQRKTGSLSAPRSLETPAIIGPFSVLGPLGSGGMGVIYKARDTSLDRVVALKRMRDEIADNPRERQRFLKEAHIVSALDHPGIVRIYSVHEAPEGCYLVFEYVEGRTLAQTISARSRLPFAEARSITAQAAEAIAYAHSQGVIHRDIKPSNIMVDAKGRVRVMDFGVARASKDAVTRLTAQGTVTGTPAYMAPEQEDGNTGPASDVYALGACLYEMLAGKPPFEGTGLSLYQAKRKGPPRPLSPSSGSAPPAGLDAVLAKALAPDPAKRFASPRELAAALGAITV